MKVFHKNIFYILRFLLIPLFFIFSTSLSFSETNNLSKLALPFQVNFSSKELQFLNSLTASDLEKLIRIIKLIIEQNTNSQTSRTQDLTGNSTANSGQSLTSPAQTIYGNSQSAQTPYYNSGTGQYQSAPAGSNSLGNNNSGTLNNSNNNSNNNPYLGNNNALQQYLGQPPTYQAPPQTQLGAITQGINQGLAAGATFDRTLAVGCPATIPEFCKNNFGVDVSGQCSEKNLNTAPLSAKLKTDLQCVCAILGKRIQSASVYRNQAQQRCANPAVANSQHTAGTAIDFSYGGISAQEQMKAFFYFKSNGYRHGCYCNTTHIHFDHGMSNNYGSCCPATLQAVQAGFNKRN